ncbi:MAG: cadmium-translocating P-type ATPase [Simkaniaceae bacterium]|nr:cadmium-translocating P-type ATPase [Simkaniaceae bacterium]
MSYLFDDFFTSEQEESISPFLEKKSRHLGHNLPIKSASLSAFCLLLAFALSFVNPSFSHLCLVIVFFLSGVPALIDTCEDLKHFVINIDILMTLAAFLAVLIGSPLEGGLLLVLFDLSGSMEEMVTRKASSALTHLTKLAPSTANIIGEDGHIHERAVRDIAIGTRVLVKAGDIVPLDGTVTEGRSFLNLVHLTGESIPVSKGIGDPVQGGSRNLDGSLTIEVTHLSSESTIARIIRLIHEAQEMKPKLQQFLDRFGKIYAPTIILLSLFFALVLPWIFSIPYLGTEGAIYRSLAFLIAASPCALIIATPTAYLSALSSCAKQGLLLKGGIALDGLASCHTIAFDKTGTLTTGDLELDSSLLLKGSLSPEEALHLAASLEVHSSHPMAAALVKHAKNEGLSLSPVVNFRAISGYGLEGTIDGKQVKIGNSSFINEKEALSHKQNLQLTFLQVNESLYAFHFIDHLRPKMANTIALLKKEFKITMLTGDHQESALAVGEKLGITNIYSGLKPEDKLKIISTLSQKEGLIMVGDGINDAPALARATIGISMGKMGSTTAVDASDIVFLHDQLELLYALTLKARKTVRIVKENITLALSVICLATIPSLLGLIPLYLAVILHEGGTLIVGLNSLRLLRSLKESSSPT